MISMPELADYDITIPLIRRDEDGATNTRDLAIRIPSGSHEEALHAGQEIGWAIVSGLPNVGDNNRYGWKIANCGVAAEPVRQ